MTRGGTYFFGGSSLLFHYFLHFLLIFILLGVFVFGVDFLVRVTGCTEGKERKNNRLSHLLAYSLVTLYHSHSHTPALITHTSQVLGKSDVLTSAAASSTGVSSGATSGAASAASAWKGTSG